MWIPLKEGDRGVKAGPNHGAQTLNPTYTTTYNPIGVKHKNYSKYRDKQITIILIFFCARFAFGGTYFSCQQQTFHQTFSKYKKKKTKKKK